MVYYNSDKKWYIALIAVPLGILLWCLRYYCTHVKENRYPTVRSVPEQPLPMMQSSSDNYYNTTAPPLARPPPTRIGFGYDANETFSSNGYTAPYPPESTIHGAPYPPDTSRAPTAPYGIMPQPLGESTHSVTLYAPPNKSSAPVPESTNLPPSYAEATKNT